MSKIDPRYIDLTILVVDDHALTRAMVQSILKGAGFYNVLGADNGEVASRRLDEHAVDVVICDWNMPTVSGIDLLRHMRSMENYAKVPFIMLTAEVYRSNVKEAIEAGVTDYIAKPFTAETLVQKLGEVLQRVKPVKKVAQEDPNQSPLIKGGR